MRKQTIVALVLGTVLVVGSVSMAYAKDWHHDGERMAQQVQLSPEQEAKYTELYKTHEANITPLYKELQMKKAEYQAFMRNTNPDPAQASKLAGELADIQVKIKNEVVKFQDNLQKENLPIHHGMGMGKMMGHRGMMDSFDCDGMRGERHYR